MTKQFKYYIDFGSGYEEVTPYGDFGNIRKKRDDDNPFVIRFELDLSLTFVGTDYDKIIDRIYNQDYERPFKIEQYNFDTSTYELQVEAIANFRGTVDYNAETAKIDTFIIDDNYTDFYNNWKNEYADYELDVNKEYISGKKPDGSKLEATKIYIKYFETSIDNETDFQSTYYPDGTTDDSKPQNISIIWDAFTLEEKESTDNGYVFHYYTYATNAEWYRDGDVKPAKYTMQYRTGIDETLNYREKTLYVYDETPLFQNIIKNDTGRQDFDSYLGTTLKEWLQKFLLKDFGNDIEFTQSTIRDFNTDNIFIKNTYIDLQNVVGEENKKSIKQIIEYIEEIFNVRHEITGSGTSRTLQFREIEDLATDYSSIDYTIETQNILEVDFLEKEFPYGEIWETQNARNRGFKDIKITYPQYSGQDEVTHDLSDVTFDFEGLNSGEDVSISGVEIIYAEYSSTTDDYILDFSELLGIKTFNAKLAPLNFISKYWRNYRYARFGNIFGKQYSFNLQVGRPNQKLSELQKHFQTLNSFDMKAKYNTNIGTFIADEVQLSLKENITSVTFKSVKGNIWILEQGVWNDEGVWIDTAEWQDS